MARPSTLWHYTDAGGLLGILGNDCAPRDKNIVGPQSCRPSFRATAVEYLNDSRELIHGLEILRKEVLLPRADELDALDYRPHEPHDVADAPNKAKFLRTLCATIEEIENRTYGSHIHCYITSFSEHPDRLSQWRGYCGGLDGFAIGIDPMKLPKTPEISIEPARYADRLGVSELTKLRVIHWMRGLLSGTEAPEASPGMLDKCVRELSQYATQFKHKGFEEEGEWRIIHLSYSEGGSYRSRGAQLIPFTTWSMPADAVVGVRVGPGPNQYENYLAAQGALHALGYPVAAKNLTKSSTPFR
ncbi:DUF2971 domain-containing protein [Rhodococcus ruber]|uniref:DUF2971 domain-containing protein n=1 Tax=Rhodococcus ruber TaxID=1830 RepID=UPI000F535266|nr:DUF2971 domain-containing protein [Rhodococcus ruber]MDO1482154.1 DUF2971 domain-containing protein [Rhodococcus ruber]